MWNVVYHRDPLLFLLYINGIEHAIGCDNVKLFTDDTFLFMNNRNIDDVKEKVSDLFEKKSMVRCQPIID